MWMTVCSEHHADTLSNYYQLPLVKRTFDCYEEQIICWRLPGRTLFLPSIAYFTDGPKQHGERRQKVTVVKTAKQSYFRTRVQPTSTSNGGNLSRLTFPKVLCKNQVLAVENWKEIVTEMFLTCCISGGFNKNYIYLSFISFVVFPWF